MFIFACIARHCTRRGEHGILVSMKKPLAIFSLMHVTRNWRNALLAAGCAAAAAGCWTMMPPPETAQPLAGNYVDPQQQEIRFGAWSFDRVPYRAWMETCPGDIVFRGFGVNFNVNAAAEIEPTAQVLAQAGVSGGRVEVGMGNFSYQDPTRFDNADRLENLRQRLAALKRNGIRPLILLNANSGAPAPIRTETAELLEDAEPGDTSILLLDASMIRAGYTGLTRQAYPTAFPLITNVTADGRCALSAPLAKPLAKGKITLHTLAVAPFAEGEVLADGTVDPRARESLRRWERYVLTVCAIARDALGTAGSPDAGFDLEVWNEYTFGSEYLDGRYYSPKRQFKEKFTYAHGGVTVSGHEVLLPMTVALVRDLANGLPGVRVVSGFSNQRPWDNGADVFPGQYGFSRHYYSGIPTSAFSPPTNQPVIDALGQERPLAFMPELRMGMPEHWLTGIKTEMMSRDLQPFPNSFKKHFRYSLNPAGVHSPVWMTEFNVYRGEWSKLLEAETGVKTADPRFQELLESLAAKSLLRSLLMLTHKGVELIHFYSARSPMREFGLLSESFFTGDKTFESAGLQLHACRRLKDFLDADAAPRIPRQLGVGRIVEHAPLLLQRGDGTAAHPDYFARDRLAILPFQTSANRFAVALYVVTSDPAHAWAPDADPLDPTRYQLPPQMFDITLTNVSGRGARVRYHDPLTGQDIPAAVVSSAPDALTVRLPLTDSPRLLAITEAAASPQILDATLDGDRLTFRSLTSGTATVTVGAFPSREGGFTTTLPVTRGTEHLVRLPLPLQLGEGIRVTVRAGALTAQYPVWDHDPALARPPLPVPTAGEHPEGIGLLRLPSLPSVPRPEAVPGFKTVPSIEDALPVLAALDTVGAEATTAEGHAAWRVTLQLDASAHPGERHLQRRYLIVPLAQGFGVKQQE